MSRRCGILLPVSSLPSKYGIGAFSKEAYEFVDFLAASGQKLWQVLPMGPTGYGDSPYQSFSTFAGNPYFIDLDTLVEKNLLLQEECEACDWGDDPQKVDYEKIYLSRFDILKKAFERFDRTDEDYQNFYEDNKAWVEEYSLFMVLKNHFDGKSWQEWPKDIRNHEALAVRSYRHQFEDEIEFYIFQQYMFDRQWSDLRHYANKAGIKIIGDIPIYVSLDSVEVWSNPKLFALDENRVPLAVAGCPPDAFSADGQLWGNPLYDWAYHKKTGFKWWIERMKALFNRFDIVRIDHFRGFDEYYSIPYGAKTAAEGHWEKGIGIELFNAIKQAFGEHAEIIAEDLGFVTETVKQLLADSGYPGMKIIEFAFDSREAGDYIPYNYTINCVVYTGTHDNDTLQGWYKAINEEDREFTIEYLDNKATPIEEIHWDFIRLALSTVADTCVIAAQDYLGLGSEARINTPSSIGGNWVWRVKKGEFTKELSQKILKLSKIYGRC